MIALFCEMLPQGRKMNDPVMIISNYTNRVVSALLQSIIINMCYVACHCHNQFFFNLFIQLLLTKILIYIKFVLGRESLALSRRDCLPAANTSKLQN